MLGNRNPFIEVGRAFYQTRGYIEGKTQSDALAERPSTCKGESETIHYNAAFRINRGPSHCNAHLHLPSLNKAGGNPPIFPHMGLSTDSQLAEAMLTRSESTMGPDKSSPLGVGTE